MAATSPFRPVQGRRQGDLAAPGVAHPDGPVDVQFVQQLAQHLHVEVQAAVEIALGRTAVAGQVVASKPLTAAEERRRR